MMSEAFLTDSTLDKSATRQLQHEFQGEHYLTSHLTHHLPDYYTRHASMNESPATDSQQQQS